MFQLMMRFHLVFDRRRFCISASFSIFVLILVAIVRFVVTYRRLTAVLNTLTFTTTTTTTTTVASQLEVVFVCLRQISESLF